VLVVFTNIDIVTGPCNNINLDEEGNLETKCKSCFLGDKALVVSDFIEQQNLTKRIQQNFPNASYFFYPAETAAAQKLMPAMLETGQKVMTNGKVPEIAQILAKEGFAQISFSLYSDWQEMNKFYGYSKKEYNLLLENIGIAVENNMEVEIFSIVTPLNIEKLSDLYSLTKGLGVSKLTLLPLESLGKAKDLADENYLDQESFERVLQEVEDLKTNEGPYISMGFGFGPSKKAIEKFTSRDTKSWVKTKTFCPAINGEYAVILGNDVYFCFKTLDEPFGRIGFVSESGEIVIENEYDFLPETIVENIDGICYDCDVLPECLGGCRSKAISDALRENPDIKFQDIMYKGQKFCRYNSQKNMR
jgi:radical SAM protein with 4Fe4S-binding SPASM domain